MAETIETAWNETQQLHAQNDMSSRFWAFRAFYGILDDEQKERYLNNVRDIQTRDTKFKRLWMQELFPRMTARGFINHYAAILCYDSQRAETNEDISNSFIYGAREYSLQTRPERERSAALKRVRGIRANSE